MKLIATYAAGHLGVFTEDRTGMRQRALIDIGDTTPTPEQMAKLAGSLSDQFNWSNVIQASTAAKQLPGEKRPYKTRDNSDPSPTEREKLITEFLATNPKTDARAIIRGLGFDDDEARLSRWGHTFGALVKARRIVGELTAYRVEKNLVRKYLYSLPS
jgi:hypothetical protein